MTYPVTITSQGQVTIPVEIRRKLFADRKFPIKANFVLQDDQAILKKEPEIDELFGSLNNGRKINMKKARKAFEHYLATRSFKNL